MTPMHTRILAALTEAGDWIKGTDLAPIVGAANHRAIQVHVAKMRSEGVAIEGGMAGYRVPIVAPERAKRVKIRKPLAKVGACKCGALITAFSKTGQCRPCAAQRIALDPAIAERRIANLRAVKGSPEHREKAKIIRQRVEAERRDDPAWQAYKREAGQRLKREFTDNPERRNEVAAIRKDVAAKLVEKAMSWCPVERRDEYRKLRKGIPAAEAKRIILEDIAAAERVAQVATAKTERDRLAAMTWEERMAEKLRNGGRIVDKFTPRLVEPAYTLGGVADMAA